MAGADEFRDNRPATTAQDHFPIIVAEWDKNRRETISVRLDTFKDCPVIDVRTWWRDDEGELKPGRSGITLAVRHLPSLADAIAKALAEARARGLLDGEGSR